jgi:hypothetical protein
MIKNCKILFTITLLFIIAFIYLFNSSFAQASTEINRRQNQELSVNQHATPGAIVREEMKNTIPNKGTESALRINEKLKLKLEGTRLKLCQQKQNMIQTRSKNMVKHMQRQMEVFDKIASRTASFYQDKVVPSGKSLDNFDTLTTDIQSKKATVSLLVSQASESAKAFECANDKPVAQLGQFREDTQAVIKAMQEYRQAIKNLIVAVSGLVANITPSPAEMISQ